MNFCNFPSNLSLFGDDDDDDGWALLAKDFVVVVVVIAVIADCEPAADAVVVVIGDVDLNEVD